MAPDRGNLVTNGTSRSSDSNIPGMSDEVLPENTHDQRPEEINYQEEAEKILVARAADPTNFTVRGVAAGLVIGCVICFSNVYFGLQTGWISGMSMPAALISFGFFRAISRYLKTQFTPVETVLVQTVAGSFGSMPLGCGMVGVMPALEFLLKPKENGPLHVPLGKLILFAVGLCLFGVSIAVPLRKQTIIKEKLKFPSGSATALIIGVLHGDKEGSTLVQDAPKQPTSSTDAEEESTQQRRESLNPTPASQAELLEDIFTSFPAKGGSLDWKYKIRLMVVAFCISALYTIVSYFFPMLHNLPILGTHIASKWLWTLNPSPAYIGQGIIMGPATTIHMLIGATVGWAILSPLAKYKGWAPGDVSSWENGSKGWIVWISLAIMLADAVVSLGWIVFQPLYGYSKIYAPNLRQAIRNHDWRAIASNPRDFRYTQLDNSTDATPRDSIDSQALMPYSATDLPELDAPPSHLINAKIFFITFTSSVVLYYVAMHFSFPQIITFAASTLALVFSLFLSIMGVRATGQTDLNPVSGISKLTQLIFSLLPFAKPENNPNAIALNLLAGAVSESAALQAGDLMQDLKCGHLLGASPRAQFYGQIIGSVVGAVVSACVYRLYTRVYEIPSGQFQTPTAYVWINTARLVTGQGLPEMAAQGALIAGAVYVVITIIRIVGLEKARKWTAFVPGGIAVAVGMYNTPSFTLARTVGGLISWYWIQWRGKQESVVVILASGLILGEGLVSIVNLIMESFNVPHL